MKTETSTSTMMHLVVESRRRNNCEEPKHVSSVLDPKLGENCGTRLYGRHDKKERHNHISKPSDLDFPPYIYHGPETRKREHRRRPLTTDPLATKSEHVPRSSSSRRRQGRNILSKDRPAPPRRARSDESPRAEDGTFSAPRRTLSGMTTAPKSHGGLDRHSEHACTSKTRRSFRTDSREKYSHRRRSSSRQERSASVTKDVPTNDADRDEIPSVKRLPRRSLSSRERRARHDTSARSKQPTLRRANTEELLSTRHRETQGNRFRQTSRTTYQSRLSQQLVQVINKATAEVSDSSESQKEKETDAEKFAECETSTEEPISDINSGEVSPVEQEEGNQNAAVLSLLVPAHMAATLAVNASRAASNASRTLASSAGRTTLHLASSAGTTTLHLASSTANTALTVAHSTSKMMTSTAATSAVASTGKLLFLGTVARRHGHHHHCPPDDEHQVGCAPTAA